MKPVIIKNIEIGKGLPKIAVPLVAANTQELEQALRVLKETAFDIIEFRADFFQEALDADFIAEQLGIARQAFPDKPLLFTFRRAQEGGNTPCSDDYYFKLLEKIVCSKQADIIDIELFAEKSGVKQTIALAHEYQTAALLCNHDFQATPSLADITGRLKTMAEWGADICKIAVMPQSSQDV
ncbi:type I 3-dehydroquinate dehydratase, partial [Neisseria sp. P0009.S007]